MSKIWALKSCPRCKGNLIIDSDEDGFYESCIMCGNCLIGEKVYFFYGGFFKEQSWFNKSCVLGFLSEFQIHRLWPDAQCGRESFVVNSQEILVYDGGFYTCCPTRKVHTPETPVGNEDNLFLNGIRERE